MRRIFLLGLLLGLSAALRAADAPRLAVAPWPLPPGTANAVSFTVVRGDDRRVHLLWLESAGDRRALRFARQTSPEAGWETPVTVPTGSAIVADATEAPALAADRHGRLTVVWQRPAAEPAGHGNGHPAAASPYFSRSADGGRTWSDPQPLTPSGRPAEFVTLAALADGRVLAAWLEQVTAKTVHLVSRIVGESGPDLTVDRAVCECCPPALTAFPDGTALLAYRGRTEENVRDIRTARFRAAAWEESRILNHDDWRLAACPVNGPALASDGGRVAAAWFTAADNDPRVLVSASPDAGGRFLLPLRLSETRPAGRPAAAILRDGALLAAWVDGTGGLRLRRVTPEFSLSVEAGLADPAAGAVRGRPRLLVLDDYRGGREPARLLSAWLQAGGGLRGALVTVPEGELLEAEKSCDCAPTAEQLAGYPFFGTVVSVFPDTLEIEVRHDEVPGLLPAGRHRFLASAAMVAAAVPGRRFIGRCDPAGEVWRLVEFRPVAAP